MRPARTAHEHTAPPERQSAIARFFQHVFRTLRWLAFSLLISITLECVSMLLWWPDTGVEHSHDMLRTELAYLDQDLKRSVLSDDPAVFAQTFAARARYLLFELTGFQRLTGWLTRVPSHDATGLRPRLYRLYQDIAPFVQAAMIIVQLFAVRLAILCLATPVFLLFSLVGLVDGLVRRDLRRWGGGRESSYLYHYAKKSVWRFVLIAWISYLALPISLHPAFILLPFASLFAISISITASTFKKYL